MSQATLFLHVKPRAGVSRVVGWQGKVLEVRIAAPAQGGQANVALVRFLAQVLGIAPSRLSIVRGHDSRYKRVAIDGLDQDEVWRKLQP